MVWTFHFTGAVGPHIASQSDLLADREPRLTVPVCAPFCYKTVIHTVLFNAKTLLGFKSFLSLVKQKNHTFRYGFFVLQGQKDLILLRNLTCLPTVATLQYPSSHLFAAKQ